MKSSGYPYPSEGFLPKSERRTAMANPPAGLAVQRDELPEHFATEPDNTHLYIPKGQIDTTSMQKTRFQIPAEIYGPVRNHAVMVLTTSANIVDRRRSLAQLQTMAANGDEQAGVVLAALNDLTLD